MTVERCTPALIGSVQQIRAGVVHARRALYLPAKHRKYTWAVFMHVGPCTKCNCFSYVCPSPIHVLFRNRVGHCSCGYGTSYKDVAMCMQVGKNEDGHGRMGITA